MSDSSLRWRVPAEWSVVNSDGEQTRLKVAQDGNTLLGSAHRQPASDADTSPGMVNGSVDGDQLYLVIYWPDKLVENYLGTIGDGGKVEGTKLDRANPAVLANWNGDPALTAMELD